MADADVSVPVTEQKFQKVDLPSLPRGVCKVSASGTHIRVSTYVMHVYFDMCGIYIDRMLRHKADSALFFGLSVGMPIVVGAAGMAGASRETCQRVACAAACVVKTEAARTLGASDEFLRIPEFLPFP
jgi:hypothetical protein